MKKLMLMSVLIATFWIPLAVAARSPDVRRGVRRVQTGFFWFCVVYVVSVLYIMPRL